MLTPAEAVGLRGKNIDKRLHRAAGRISAATLATFSDRLRDDAWRNHVVYERDGVAEAVRIMLRPLAATQEQISYVHHVCTQLFDALSRLPDLYLTDPDVRRLVALDDEETGWLKQIWTPKHRRHNPIFGRLDAVCDFASRDWQTGLAFLEANLSGIGGIYYSPVVEQLVMRDVVPEIRHHDSMLQLDLPRDQRDLFMQTLIEHADAIGRSLHTLAFIEPKYAHSGPDEQRVLAEFIEHKYGVSVVHVDPRELSLVNGEVQADGRVIDIAYRDYEVRDLIALAREGVDIAPMKHLFADNRMVSSIAGDFDHKSCWELLTSPEIAQRHFSPDECRLFEQHVLWTRIMRPCQTTDWERRDIDLVRFAQEHREQLVLKPNRSYGGTGVYIGSTVLAAEWEQRVQEALRGANDPQQQWVLQRAVTIPSVEFPVLSEQQTVVQEPYYSVMGFTATRHGLGIMCRVSQKQVVNVAQRGGIAAVLISRDADQSPLRPGSAIHSSGARETFREKISAIRDLDAVISLLNWDEETCLPERGRAQRGEQFATLESMRHRLILDPELQGVAGELAQTDTEDPTFKRELELYRRLLKHEQALPDTLVKACARGRSRAIAAWEQARDDNDYALFEEAFTTLLDLTRERGQALSTTGEAYDGLLDEHEPGLTRTDLEPLLASLSERLVPLIAKATERSRSQGAPNVGPASVEAQSRLAEAVLRAMGFDFSAGRMDVSTHPFTVMAGAQDVRLTVRYKEDQPLGSLYAALHEGGHGLYDQGYGLAHAGTLLCDAPSIGMHESQSRLWENHIGRSKVFWQGFLPQVANELGSAVQGLNVDALYRIVNRVEPGLNRVSADELTYNLHIVMRSELELALLNGQLDPSDLPQAWAEKTQRYLGLTPPDDTAGCLQDIHWALGAFGYFPTYTLGNLYAAMLMEKMQFDVPGLEASIAAGDLSRVTTWLREHVHDHGAMLTTAALVENVTGKALSAKSFLDYVGRKYG